MIISLTTSTTTQPCLLVAEKTMTDIWPLLGNTYTKTTNHCYELNSKFSQLCSHHRHILV